MPDRSRPPHSLRVRLAVAFVAVAVAAVAVLSALLVVATGRDVSRLAREDQDAAADHLRALVVAAFVDADGWGSADLSSARLLANDQEAALGIVDDSGRAVATADRVPPGGRAVARPVLVRGRSVGTMTVTFAAGRLTAPERNLRHDLLRTVAVGAGAATVLALVTAAVVARRIARPVVSLTRAARAMEAGERSARAVPANSPSELGELARAFNGMADTLVREEALRRAMLADVAHELRTPLAVVQATIEGMLDGVVDASPSQLDSVRDDIVRLGRLVGDLETLATADAASLSLEPRVVDLADIVAAALDELRVAFGDAGVEVRSNLTPALLRADPQRVHQIITNLLTNAIKFTPAGGRVDVDVTAERSSARLVVTDTGVGIPPDERPRVFDRFWRGTQAQTTSGSGIGLSVVAELVAAHQGTVTIDAGHHPGTRFVVLLPRE